MRWRLDGSNEALLASTDLLDELVTFTAESLQLLQGHSRRVNDFEADRLDAVIRVQEALQVLAHAVYTVDVKHLSISVIVVVA